jgi:hypothetical protein
MSRKLQIIEVIYHVAGLVDQVDDQVLARAIGTMIFDVPTTYSGMVSTALLDEHGYRPSVTKCCKEHFMNRQRSGEIIIEKSHSGALDREWLIEFINEATTVHLTTSEENQILGTIQNHPETKHLTWEDQYDMAGIELVEDPGTMPPKLRNKLKKVADG